MDGVRVFSAYSRVGCDWWCVPATHAHSCTILFVVLCFLRKSLCCSVLLAPIAAVSMLLCVREGQMWVSEVICGYVVIYVFAVAFSLAPSQHAQIDAMAMFQRRKFY